MADEDKSSKTEQPTGKRLGEARDKGNVARSVEIANWGSLVAGTAALTYIVPWMMRRVVELNVPFISDSYAYPVDSEHVRLLLIHVGAQIGIILAPIVFLFFVVGVGLNYAQVGWTFSWQKLELKFSALSLFAGAKRLLGLHAVTEFLKGLIKLGVIGAIFGFILWPRLNDLEIMPQFTIDATLQRIDDVVYILFAVSAGVMTILAAADFAYQKYDYIENLKMTKQEVKDEAKQADGDPKVKQRIAKLRMERARARMMMNVANADVIITNPTHYAVALTYDMDNMAAPRLVGKGVDDVAKRIREVAEENEIPIVENPPLARAIYAFVEIDQEIPPKYYHAVAEVISYVFRLTGRLARRPGERLLPPKPDWSLDPERETDAAAE